MGYLVRKITLLACLVGCLAVPAGAQAAWSTDGRCVVPARSKAALDQVRPRTQLVARGVACSKAAASVQGMVENGVEYSSANRFTYRARGSRWSYRWTCTRRIGRIRKVGRVSRISCRSGRASMRFVLYS